MSQTDQQQDESASRLEKPFFGMRTLGTEDYHIDGVLDYPRFMCPNCGLIFDYKFDHEEPGWPDFDPPLDIDGGWAIDEEGREYWEKFEERCQSCSRCGTNFEEIALLPVKIGLSDFKFTQLSFFVEDQTQEKVVKAIAKSLGKELQTHILGNSSHVEAFFKSVKAHGTITKVYCLIDGDNNPKKSPKELNFIQLEKYCIENYLLDFEICGEISNKEPQQIRAFILEIVKQYAKGKDSLLNLLFNRLSESDITDESLKHVNGKLILEVLLQRLGIREQQMFIDKYVAKCQEKSKLAIILPSRIVEVIQNA